MEDELNKAVNKSKNSAVIAIIMWICAIVGAFVIKCVLSFIKWVFQK